jgi:hypothetical protein
MAEQIRLKRKYTVGKTGKWPHFKCEGQHRGEEEPTPVAP